VATCHDFFNFIAVAVLLPIELATGILQRSATTVSALLGDIGGVTYKSPLKVALKTAVKPVKHFAAWIFESERGQGVAIIFISAALIFLALMLLVRALRAMMQTRVEVSLNRVLGRRMVISVLVGIVVTVMVQSSSITTSLLVPLAGARIVTIQQAFPITVGANIGTTVTALLASMAVSGRNAGAGVTIALVHLGFNIIGTMMILPFASLRALPIRAAEWLAGTAVNSRGWAIVYVMALFYGLPALFAFLFR